MLQKKEHWQVQEYWSTLLTADVLRGFPKFVIAASACISTNIGLVPSWIQETQHPSSSSMFINNPEGLPTSSKPSFFISKTPISFVDPNLFFTVNRLNLLLAVLEKKVGLKLSNQDVYMNVVGGLKVEDRASDLSDLFFTVLRTR